MYGKGISRDYVHNDFEALLEKIQPSEDLFALISEMLKDSWTMMNNQLGYDITAVKKHFVSLDKDIDQLVDRIMQVTNVKVVSRLENRIAELEEEKAILAEKLKNPAKPKYSYEELLELSMRILSKPHEIWRSGTYPLRRMLIKLVVSEPLEYSKNHGYRTPMITLPFKYLEEIKMDFIQNKNVVPPPRVELGTC